MRGGEPEKAAPALEALLRNGSATPTNRVVAEGYLGEAYEKLGRFDDAFAAFSRANALQHAQFSSTFGGDRGPMAPGTVKRLIDFVSTVDLPSWREVPPATGPVPVFLVGFPRSGTTLLDQILASHPGATTLEERDTLADAAGALIGQGEEFDRWASLPVAEIERLRARYWQQVQAGLSGAPIKDVFVDKQPLNAIFLPLIHRLFPGAKIILALRDPRDAVLSCFQQRFSMNPAMFQLLRLDTATAYYDCVMKLVEISRARLPLKLHEIRYEAVVGDFEASVRALLAFLGLEWDDSVRDFAATAKSRAIGTPSRAQVVQPLYSSAQGKWRNYRRFLERHMAILDAWARTYGYGPS